MLFFFMGSLALLVYGDAKLFRRQHEAGYTIAFHYSPLVWALWHAALGVVVLPIYLLRRKKFKDSLAAVTFVQESSISEVPSPGGSRVDRIASDAYGLLLIWAGGMSVWMVIVEIFFICYPQFQRGIEEMTISAVVSSGWMVFLIFQTTQRDLGEKFLDFVALKRKGLPIWKLAVAPMAVGLLFAAVSSRIIMDRSAQPETPISKILESTNSVPWILIFVATAVILAPLLEEITFRGYFYRVLSLSKGKVFAVCLISFLFAFLHVGQYWGDWSAIGMVAALGLVLALIRVWTGSTIASAVTHYFYNAGVTIIPIVMLVFSNPAYMEYRMKFDQLDYAKKESLLQKSIAADPSLAEAYNDLAWLYAEKGEKLDEASFLIDKALKMKPENIAFLDTKAEIMFKLGHVEEAIAIEEGIKTEDGFLSAHVEKQLKRFKQSRDSFKPVN